MYPEVSVVILNYNGKHWLEKFLPSVMQSSYPNLKVWVADNASVDHSIIFIESQYPSINIIRIEENKGYTGGYNEALKYINSPYSILLNSDVEVTPDWVQPMVEYAENHPDVAIIQPKIRWHTHPDYFEYAGGSGGHIDKYGFPFCRGRIFATLEKDQGQYDDISEIMWASGSCLFVRTSDFKEAGGFYEPFFAHMEEIDLCWRCRRMGKKIMVVPNSVVYHVGGGTLQYGSSQKTFLNYRNGLMLLYRNLESTSRGRIIFSRMILDGISAARYWKPSHWSHIAAIWKAHQAFRKWKKQNHKKPTELPGLNKGLSPYSIVYAYFIQGKKYYSQVTKK